MIKTKVSIGSNTVKKDKGKPFRQFLSLVYVDAHGKKIHVDLESFRPDIKLFIKPDKKYDAKLEFRIETNDEGEDIQFLKRVILNGGQIFVRVR